ncbi:MAG: hypothetical protein JST04_11690 [Bdellovibrionales bacterium]|nr:hypothetical protein [Bdellovibrionales bacterium]
MKTGTFHRALVVLLAGLVLAAPLAEAASARRLGPRTGTGVGKKILPLSTVQPHPEPSPVYFPILREKARKIEDRNLNEGWAYVISGGIALAVSIPGYYLSEDVFARSVYSLGETLAVGAVGYGAYLILVSDDYARFVRILESSPSLSIAEKEKLSYEFLNENAKRAKALRKIRVISHGLTAGLNFLNGATSDNRELRTALYFIGAINVLAAGSFLLKESEEEAFLDEIRSKGKVEAVLGVGRSGPLLGLQYRF